MDIVVSSLGQVLLFIFYLLVFLALVDAYVGFHLHYHNTRHKLLISALISTIVFILLMFGYNAYSEPSTSTIIYSSIIFIVLESSLILLSKLLKGRHTFPILLVLPAYLGLVALILYPMFFEFYLSFYNLNLYTLKSWLSTGQLDFVGIKNYINVFYHSPLTEATFWDLFLRTLLWTFVNVFFHVSGGFIVALCLNKVKLKSMYRTIIVIPWAMPQVVAILAWRGEFHIQHGYINHLLESIVAFFPFLAYIGIGPVNWMTDYPLLMCIITNVWLGIPFMAVIILGGLQSIPQSYYDAAAIDGASSFQKLYRITIPMLRPVLAPAITLGALWTFNNINVIYLMTGQAGGTERADILVTALYKAAFTYSRYSFSAAFAVMIFVVLLISTYVWMKIVKASDSVY
jgi:arabinogalactan oligomer / maltooligosaccharide transport system permease protein